MKKNCRSTTIENLSDVIFCEFCLTIHDNLITLDRYNLTSILIYEVLIPALQYTSSKLATYGSLHVLLVNLYFLSKVENLQNILILLIAHSTEKSCYWQLLLTIDISIHDIVNISSELNP